LLLLFALDLVRRSGAQCSVKGDVIGAVTGRTRLHVAAALAIGMRARPPARLFTGQAVELGLEFTRGKFGGRFDLFAAFPPEGILLAERTLRRRLYVGNVRRLLRAG
jgi:hypothetical protein